MATASNQLPSRTGRESGRRGPARTEEIRTDEKATPCSGHELDGADLVSHHAKIYRGHAHHIRNHVARVAIGANEAAWAADHWRSLRVHVHELLGTLLTRKKSLFHRQLEDKTLVGPSWHDCIEHEFQLRKAALRLVWEHCLGIQATQHSMIHNIGWNTGSLFLLPSTQCQ